ncbi:NAD(P)-binding domain-containing protein [Alicycliphilus denitrificans]|uniref:NAD(P)-binding domain-containing protein n=1 Tax=Alicycliphilus denitrificans TaxID=179636 RepID=UPI00384E0AAF
MKVTVIGAGNMGAAFVKQLSLAGHEARLVAHYLEPLAGLGTSIAPTWIRRA